MTRPYQRPARGLDGYRREPLAVIEERRFPVAGIAVNLALLVGLAAVIWGCCT